jgi:putative membrane protein
MAVKQLPKLNRKPQPMPHIHHTGFQIWEVALTLALVSAALIYIRGCIRLRRLERNQVEGWRLASFLSGLLSIWIAMASPLAALDHQFLTIHMVQHLLLMTLAPPLVWLGAPFQPLSRGLQQQFVSMTNQFLRWPPMKKLGATITRPAICWLAAAGTLIGWHIPYFFALGMRSETWHGIEQVSFLLSGLLFWWPVFQPWLSASHSSDWTMILYLFLATLPCDILSGFLVFCDRVVYPAYSSSSRALVGSTVGFSALGASAIEDQQSAGALMWTCVTVVYLIAGTILAWRLLSPESTPERFRESVPAK